jgi:hypothetical protein
LTDPQVGVLTYLKQKADAYAAKAQEYSNEVREYLIGVATEKGLDVNAYSFNLDSKSFVKNEPVSEAPKLTVVPPQEPEVDYQG